MPTLDDMQQLAARFPQCLVPLGAGRVVGWRQAGSDDAESTLVLLHGISSGAASWLGVALAMQRLRPEVRVLAWDAPGYGDSNPLSVAVPSDADYAHILAQSLDALGVRRCMLVGHSLGTLMAAGYARMAVPGQVSQLVLLSPAGGYGAAERAEQRARIRQQRLDGLREHGVAGLAAAIDQRLAAPDTAEEVRQWLRWNTACMQPGGYAQAVELLCGSDLGRSIGQLAMPVHVWVGEHDSVTPPAQCRHWAEALSAPYAEIAAAGHALPVEQPGVIAQKLADLYG